MRIAHVISGFLPDDSGGTQLHVRDLAQGQRARGHDVCVFTRLGGDTFREFELSRDEFERIPVTRLTYNFADVETFEQLYTNPRIDERFGRFLDDVRPDLVHVHHLTCLSTSMIEVAAGRGIPVVMTLHDYWMVCPRGQRIRSDDLEICEDLDRARCLPCLHALWPHLLPVDLPRRLLDRLLGRDPALAKLGKWEAHIRRMLDRCSLTISPSRFHRDRFVEWGLDPNRSFAVVHGLPREDLLAEPRGGKPVERIGFIGSVIPSKGVHVLVDAFAELDAPGIELHVHGEAPVFHGDGGYLDRLKARVPGGKHVEFHGRYEQRDLPEVFATLDLLVVPSIWWESFCLTAREGALAGLPVVASNTGGIADAVEDGLAVGFRTGDAGDLARVLGRLIGDADLRDRMSRRADRVRDLADCVDETMRLYDRASTT